MNERPVTGSCERCGRQYALLIPVPGSGDLEVQRVAEVIAWCAGCGQFVGRLCCWHSDGFCVDCTRLATTADAAGFARLGAARAALRQLDGAAAEFSSIAAGIVVASGPDRDAAVAAWEDAWLAAGALRTRIDGSRDAVVARLRALPAAESERAREIEQQLGVVLGSHEERWRLIVGAIADAGAPLAAGAPPPVAAALDDPAAAEPEQTPTVAAVPLAVPLTIRAPRPIAIPVAAAVRVQASAAPALANLPTSTGEVRHRTSDNGNSAAAVGPRRVVQRRIATDASAPSAPSRPAIATPAPAEPATPPPPAPVVQPPAAPPGAAPVPASTVPSQLPAARRQDALRGPGARVVLLLVAVLAVVGAGFLAPAGLLDTGPTGNRLEVPVGGEGGGAASTVPSPSDERPAASVPTPAAVTFDLDQIGPLEVAERAATRIIGDPAVAALPSPFDRSVRLAAGPPSGFCIGAAAEDGVGSSSVTLDLHRDDPPASGQVSVGLARTGTDPALAVSFDLTRLGEASGDGWYSLTVTLTADGGRLTVVERGSGSPVLETDLETVLETDPTLAPSPGEACLIASLTGTAASVLIDNVRAAR